MFSVRGYDPIMQLIHEDDMAEAFYLALVKEAQGAFNVASDGGLRYSQIARLMGKLLVALPAGLVYPVVEILFRLNLMGFGKSQLDYIRYPLSIDGARFQQELGFAPRYTTQQALEAFRDSGKR
jgi:UDP-glucose 4-epimerase